MHSWIRISGRAATGLVALAMLAAQGPQTVNACAASTSAGTDSCMFEQLVWDLVRDTGESREVNAYLHLYPNGTYADDARRRVDQIARNAAILELAKARR